MKRDFDNRYANISPNLRNYDHFHEFQGLTGFSDRHDHEYYCQCVKTFGKGAKHYHYVEGVTSFDDGHEHIISLNTSLPIEVEPQYHTHTLESKTGVSHRHSHYIKGRSIL